MDQLPVELIWIICMYVRVESILNMRLVNKYLESALDSNFFWNSMIKKNFPEITFPGYSKYIDQTGVIIDPLFAYTRLVMRWNQMHLVLENFSNEVVEWLEPLDYKKCFYQDDPLREIEQNMMYESRYGNPHCVWNYIDHIVDNGHLSIIKKYDHSIPLVFTYDEYFGYAQNGTSYSTSGTSYSTSGTTCGIIIKPIQNIGHDIIDFIITYEDGTEEIIRDINKLHSMLEHFLRNKNYIMFGKVLLKKCSDFGYIRSHDKWHFDMINDLIDLGLFVLDEK